MRTNTLFVLLIALLVLAGIGYLVWGQPSSNGNALTSTTTSQTTATSTADTTSDGTITFARLPQFGLAVTQDQAPKAYIPPCAQGFNYCLYYNGNAYAGTNFESAGLSITKRPDLASANACLTQPPAGYATMKPASTNSGTTYSTSVFSPVGDAAAGHYASGEVYRLWLNDAATCYEFQTRIGETQFANYPAGTIKQFTDADRQALQQELRKQLETITISVSGSPAVIFSQPKG